MATSVGVRGTFMLFTLRQLHWVFWDIYTESGGCMAHSWAGRAMRTRKLYDQHDWVARFL